MAESASPQNQVLEDIEIGKYLEILRRRKWWVILTATAIFVTTLVAAFRMPDVYHSETVILVDPQKVPDAFVPATVNTTAADRLATVKQEIMSPTRLKQLLSEPGFTKKSGATARQAVSFSECRKRSHSISQTPAVFGRQRSRSDTPRRVQPRQL